MNMIWKMPILNHYCYADEEDGKIVGESVKTSLGWTASVDKCVLGEYIDLESAMHAVEWRVKQNRARLERREEAEHEST